MNRVLAFALAVGLAAGLGWSGQAVADAAGVVKKKSAHSVQDTIDRLDAILREKGLTIFAKVDHAAGGQKAGLALRPTSLLIFGNPKLGTPLMQSNQTIGLDLPQKALAFEDANGDVYLVYNDPSYLAARHAIADKADVFKKVTGALNAMTDAAVK